MASRGFLRTNCVCSWVVRARPAKPLTVRFETGLGAQAQMDWSTYEIDFTQEGRRKVQLFSYILGHSPRQYIHFTVRQDFETTIRQHIEAFKRLGETWGHDTFMCGLDFLNLDLR